MTSRIAEGVGLTSECNNSYYVFMTYHFIFTLKGVNTDLAECVLPLNYVPLAPNRKKKILHICMILSSNNIQISIEYY